MLPSGEAKIVTDGLEQVWRSCCFRESVTKCSIDLPRPKKSRTINVISHHPGQGSCKQQQAASRRKHDQNKNNLLSHKWGLPLEC